MTEQRKLEVLANEVGQRLASVIDKISGTENKTGFCLLVFDFGEDPMNLAYVSNADRDDMIPALEEYLKVMKQEQA